MKHIVIFASGSGSNAEQIIKFFKNSNFVVVSKVYTNNSNAGVIDRCKRLSVPCTVFSKEEFISTNSVLKDVKKNADFIVLAGFLWKIPEDFIKVFPDKIINIHPALLPKYGGKGMYGMHVHKAVKDNNEPETGITIHYVNQNYDEGAIIFQAKTPINTEDSVEEIAQKVHVLEHTHFPKVIEETILKHE